MADSQKRQTSKAGGKAEGLYRLERKGCKVPPFIVLDTGVFAKSIDHSSQKIGADWHSPIVKGKIDDWIKSLSTDFPTLAVRSSAVGEDGSSHAYPGMLDTVLHVKSRSELTAAIQKVAESIWSERLKTYRREKGINEKLLPAVIIQKQIEAEYSGVLFTTYPVYPNELLIHLVEGYGDKLVSGQSDPIEVAFDKASGRIITSGQTDALPGNGLLESLFLKASYLEKSENQALDIEFCITGDEVFYLQMRPVTTPLAKQLVLDNSNIQESYCGATTELTFGFARKAYQTVYTQTMRAVGLKEKTIEANQEVVSNLLYKYRGNIYYNINNWYRGLQLLPAFRQNKADMERMMGLEEPVNFVESSSDSLWRILQKLPSLMVNMLRLLRSFQRLKRDTALFQNHFESEFKAFYSAEPSAFSLADCKEWYDRLTHSLLERWHVPIVNDFFVMMQNGKVHRQLENAGVENPDAWLKTQLIGDESLPSLQPAIELEKLGRNFRKETSIVELIDQFPKDLHEQVAEKFPDAFREIERYIYHYGDRTIGELKLETTTMRVDPAVFYKYLQNYLRAEYPINRTHEKVTSQPLRIPNLKKLREGIYRREALRLERTKLFGMYRSLFLRAGALLKADKKLETTTAVFHLTLEELESVLQGASPPSPDKINERKAELETFRNAEIPARVYLPGRERGMKTGQSEDGTWQGESAVPGFAEGEVVCIREPGEWTDLRGKIICALRTDPGWAPLFPGCRGVLIEKGSSLSHSVIMLRELGIPTIINLPGISANLASGTFIKMDANEGKITIE